MQISPVVSLLPLVPSWGKEWALTRATAVPAAKKVAKENFIFSVFKGREENEEEKGDKCQFIKVVFIQIKRRKRNPWIILCKYIRRK